MYFLWERDFLSKFQFVYILDIFLHLFQMLRTFLFALILQAPSSRWKVADIKFIITDSEANQWSTKMRSSWKFTLSISFSSWIFCSEEHMAMATSTELYIGLNRSYNTKIVELEKENFLN